SAGSALLYTNLFGGISGASVRAVAVDASGSAYVTGLAGTGFPTTPGAFQTMPQGSSDGFVTKLKPSGTGYVYSTYLGGTGSDNGQGIAVDSAGNAYVTGVTGSTNFPTTVGAFQTTLAGGGDAFLTKLNPTGTGLVYSSYLG